MRSETFRNHPLRHSMAHPTADLAGGERKAPGGVRGPVDQHFVRWIEAAAVDRLTAAPSEAQARPCDV